MVATYREHGHALARGVEATAVMAEMFGRVEGCSRGRGGSMHLFDVEHRFYGGNAIVGGGLPIAAGLALADHLRGTDRITACFFGEGAMAEGEFHETINLAALWQAAVLFVCENNLYAMGTALERSESATDLALRRRRTGVASWGVDGMDVEAVEDCGATGGPGRSGPVMAPASSRPAPTASAPTRCTTPSCTGSGRRSTAGRSSDPITVIEAQAASPRSPGRRRHGRARGLGRRPDR